MWNLIQGIDWQATGILAITVWQAVKEWRNRKQARAAKQPAPRRPPTIPPRPR